jgi:rare lipoprotein A
LEVVDPSQTRERENMKHFIVLFLALFLLTEQVEAKEKHKKNVHKIEQYAVSSIKKKLINTKHHKLNGTASWYGPRFNGKKTSSGEKFNQNNMTASHKTLPFGTKVKVTNLDNHKTVTVTINDRGPFIKGRIIDLSKGAAKKIDMSGTEKVSLQILENKV